MFSAILPMHWNILIVSGAWDAHEIKFTPEFISIYMNLFCEQIGGFIPNANICPTLPNNFLMRPVCLPPSTWFFAQDRRSHTLIIECARPRPAVENLLEQRGGHAAAPE